MATVYRDANGRFTSREAFNEARALAREAGVEPAVRIDIVTYRHESPRQRELDTASASALGYDPDDYTDDGAEYVEYDFDDSPY